MCKKIKIKKTSSLKRRLLNIYTKTDAKRHLQNLADKLKNELKQIEMKEAHRAKIRVKTTWEIEGETFTKYFFQNLEQERM